jgi:rare lipoprotein A
VDSPLAASASVLSETATTALIANTSLAEADVADSSSSGARQRFLADQVAVLPHALDANQAATVYLRSIPVVTLVGGELATLGESKEAHSAPTEAAQDPVVRANEIVERLLALAETEDPAAIEARWLPDQQAFVVAWEDEVLVTVNRQAILPDTTENPAEDVLQMANRMRRLLGDAPALSRVEGMPEPVRPAAPQVGIVTSTVTGTASWYGPGFHGRRSASGEVFNQNDLTAAHRTLPFGTRVRVTNLRTGQQVTVRINDRGPFSHGRIIDLSAAAAGQIGLRASGVGQVQIEVLSNP